MSNIIIYLNDDNFQKKILQYKKLYLIDFWAEWCSPCKTISQTLEEVAEELKNILIIAKLNVDENPIISKKYNIRSIPTLLLFKNGVVISTKVGVISKEKLKEFINTNL